MITTDADDVTFIDASELNIDFTPFEITYFGQRYYIQPETIFRHHFTGEPMIYIRRETINKFGHGTAEIKIVTLDQLNNMRDPSLIEEDD